MRSLIVLLAVLIAPGCANVATLTTPEAAVGVLDVEAREVYGDRERLEFGKRVQVELPAKLAVVDVAALWGDEGKRTRQRRLVALARHLEEDLESYKDVVSVYPPDYENHGRRIGLEEARGEAARHQADLMLAYECHETVEEGHNLAAIFKLLLVPMLFLPTEEDEVTLDVRAVVVDVRNGLLYTTFDDHREATVTTSVAGETDAVREALDSLFEDTLEKMRLDLGRKLRALD